MHTRRCVLLALFLVSPLAAQDGTQLFFDLGDFPLANGETIDDARIGYRTFGQLDETRSNTVLIAPWFMGTSAESAKSIGPGNTFDSDRFFVVAVDAFGNGVATSPSNSPGQSGQGFPRFTIGDLVESQYRLLTEGLGLERIHAVAGGSMGGMQAFQWAVSHPDFVARIVSSGGTPQLSTHGMLLWHAHLRIIEMGRDLGDLDEAMDAIGLVHTIALYSPVYQAKRSPPGAIDKYFNYIDDLIETFDPEDWAAQVQAMVDHDIYAPFDGSIDAAAERISAELLVIYNQPDNLVYSQPADDLARALGTTPLILDNPDGHIVSLFRGDEQIQAIQEFLAD